MRIAVRCKTLRPMQMTLTVPYRTMKMASINPAADLVLTAGAQPTVNAACDQHYWFCRNPLRLD